MKFLTSIQFGFDALYYIDGTKINSAEDLEATELFGTSGKMNILGNLMRPGTLLIIDDLKSDYERIVDKLRNNCNAHSCVILTSQTAVRDKSICFELEFPTEKLV